MQSWILNIGRLQVTIAKTLQSLPELKRDGNTVLGSVCSELLYDTNSTSRFSGVLPQAEFVPKLAQQLQENPVQVIEAFETIRSHGTCSTYGCISIAHGIIVVTGPSGVRFAVTGNVLRIERPRSTWEKYFSESLTVRNSIVTIILALTKNAGEPVG